jgi:hypothetical protein
LPNKIKEADMERFTELWWGQVYKEAQNKISEAHYDLAVSYGLSQMARMELERCEDICNWIVKTERLPQNT